MTGAKRVSLGFIFILFIIFFETALICSPDWLWKLALEASHSFKFFETESYVA